MTRDELHKQFTAMAEARSLAIDVISDGPVNADVAIIGEGLGETEIRKGATFVGGAGRLLFDSLRKYGLTRSNVYVTNVVKRQISLSRKGNERHTVYADELRDWIDLVRWELQQLPNLRTVFLMGNYALEALLGYSGVTKWRGSVLDIMLEGRPLTAVCTMNPAYALRDFKQEPMFLMDAEKLDRVVRGTFKEYEVEQLINPTYREALDFIRSLRASPKPVSFDIEVLNRETACFGLANDGHVAMCINLRDHVKNRFTTQEEADILLAIQDLCDSHSVVDGVEHKRIIAQNGSFDAYWTRLYDHLCVPIYFDTLLAHHTLYPQFPHTLAFLTAQYTNHPYYKDEGKNWREGGDVDQFWRYNCNDAAITFEVYRRLKRELKEQGLEKFFYGHVMRAQPHLISATVHGVAVDLALKARITEDVNEDVAKLKAEFWRLAQEAVDDDDYWPNPNSPAQLKDLFFSQLKLVGRGASTDENNRKHILKNPKTPPIAREMITALDKFKKADKFRGTYAESRPSADGRMRCEYKQYGTSKAPGRLSSAGLLDGTGLNLQNQPPRARAMYVADPGYVFVYFDLAQAEARVVAYRADIETWKEQFERARRDGSYDAHRALASEMFKIPYDEVPKKDTYIGDDGQEHYTIRYTAKRCRHGLNYRMEEYRLSEVTELPFHEARKAFTLYHSITPELRQWWQQEERLFRQTRTGWNALGRRWKVIQRLDDDVLKSIIAFYPQSTVGDKITQVWYQAEEDDDWPENARVCLDVHDNLVALALPEKTAKTALRILQRYAESPIMVKDAWGRKTEPLIIPAELKMSVPDENGVHRWSNMKTVTL